MEIKTKAIVMGAASKGEADKRVRLFSVDHGIIEATARGVKKQGAKLAACTFMFAFVEVVLAEKNGFYTVTSVDLVEPFQELSLNIEKFELGSAALEILSEFVKGQDDCSNSFVEVLNLFKLLCFSDNTDYKLVFSKWIIDTLKDAGYKLELSKCSVCGRLAESTSNLFMDMESGSVFCGDHKPINGIIRDITPQIFKVVCSLPKVKLAEMNGRQLKDEHIKSDDVFDFLIALSEGIIGKKLKSILHI